MAKKEKINFEKSRPPTGAGPSLITYEDNKMKVGSAVKTFPLPKKNLVKGGK